MNPNYQKQVIVREVWASNLYYELSMIDSILPFYSIVSFDIEFPGTIFTLNIDKHLYSNLPPSTNYALTKANVDGLKIIQLGLALSDPAGNLPDFGTPFTYIWQFNFCDFDIGCDACNTDSILLLQRQGMDFSRSRAEGIPSRVFIGILYNYGLLFKMSCLVWITFQGGYDFGFMIKLLMGQELPHYIHEFRFLMSQYFGSKIYDIKHMMKFCNGLYGGLEKVAKTLNVDRVVGKSHQAGSDSLLTLQTFMKLKNIYFNGEENIKLANFEGVLYGLHEANNVILDS